MKTLFVIVISWLLISCGSVEITEKQDNCTKYQRPSGFCM